jgi:glucose/mannose-6-phosphate isomerase
MINLDNLEQIKELDKGNYLGSVEALADQVRQTWEEVQKIVIPEDYRQVNKIVLNGMGGSSFGGLVVKAVFADRLQVPLEVINSYTVPAYVDENTLFIFASYSGTTEEILNTIDEAISRGAKCMGISAGGKLGEVLTQKNLPYYRLDPKFNPSNQPRAGLGYSIIGAAGLLKQAGLLELTQKDIDEVISVLEETNAKYGVSVGSDANLAKQYAMELLEKVIVLVAAEHLAGSVHVFRNQLHETAKNFADYFLLSELNHHLMEGLSHPWTNPENLIFLQFKSGLYYPRIQKRLAITKDVIEQNKIPVLELELAAESKLAQAFELIGFGGWCSFYLSMLNGVNPSLIPWVDYFKNKLTN